MKVLKPSHHKKQLLKHSLGLFLGTCRAHQHYRVSLIPTSASHLTTRLRLEIKNNLNHLMEKISDQRLKKILSYSLHILMIQVS